MLFSYSNVWNTCLHILRSRGFYLYLVGDPGANESITNCTWNAEKNGIRLRGNNPIELLGLVTIYEHHQPAEDTSYWWQIEGENLIEELENAWRDSFNT